MRTMVFDSLSRFSAALAATFVLSAAAPQPVPPVENTPVPHRAIYRIGLAESENRSGITGADGRMVFEVAGNACDGYTMSQRLVVRLSAEEGDDRLLDFRVSTFEAGDGALYRFVSKTMMNDRVVEEVQGSARRSSGGLDVRLQSPNEKTVKIAGTPLFPSQHLHALLAAARSDQRFFASSIYEGAGTGENADTATAVIGTAQRDQANGPLTKGKTRWPVSIAYFSQNFDGEQEFGEETPVYQMNFMLYENGVTRELIMDYGDYSLSGTLESITALDQEFCSSN
jgi:hypothetical protein